MYKLLGTSLAKAATDWGRKAPSAVFCTDGYAVSIACSFSQLYMLPINDTAGSVLQTHKLPSHLVCLAIPPTIKDITTPCLEGALSAF